MADQPEVIRLSEVNSDEISPRFARLSALKDAFKSEYGREPTFFARAPGRVNLIGEHIDYHGYGVLPMALDQDIVIACCTNDSGTLNLANKDGKYPKFNTSLTDFVIDKSKPEWYHYVLCGLKGVLEHCKISQPTGMNLLMEGLVPRSAGLSSSSAIVCASALTAAYANDNLLPKKELASVCTWSEKYIGTEGGGMDQSISYLAEEGTAKLIDFDPLHASVVHLPAKAAFVVTNSCVELNKAATSHFNTRVLEGQLGVKIIAKNYDLEWKTIKKMKILQERLEKNFDEMIRIAKKILKPEPYSREKVCQILSIDEEEFASTILNEKTKDLKEFRILDRTLHVLTEALRVRQFKLICDEQPENVLESLGHLMNASHESCRDHYECSGPELDVLTEVCRTSGALGSRLTGAGWAGCAVSLVESDHAETFQNRVREEFYQKRKLPCTSAVMFVSSPGDGAKIYLV